MITAHPPLLRELVERCETLRRRLAGDNSAETARRLEDAAYTLCVITATRQLDTALFVARRQIAEAMRQEQPLRHWQCRPGLRPDDAAARSQAHTEVGSGAGPLPVEAGNHPFHPVEADQSSGFDPQPGDDSPSGPVARTGACDRITAV
ncbi:DUF5133 domain-containing protein [Streptomyces bobili]|uniref:DUF5133 domain-containing protein n=1 Tax=Streptomyces bobili TaxID=67280 RepID=UPI00378B00E0